MVRLKLLLNIPQLFAVTARKKQTNYQEVNECAGFANLAHLLYDIQISIWNRGIMQP